MSEYEIGRDVQDLRSRVERIESSLRMKPGWAGADDRGTSISHEISGGTSDVIPVLWKPKAGEPVPPFLSSLLGVPLARDHLHPDDPPQVKTWKCRPEPFTLMIHWSGGGSDELYKLVHQTFSILKWTDPNSGHVSATFTYAGTVIASGKAKTVDANECTMAFSLNAIGGGAPIKEFWYFAPLIPSCKDNYPWTFSRSFDPGEFDLVGGASWRFTYSDVQRC
jgi:hypothetical protein